MNRLWMRSPFGLRRGGASCYVHGMATRGRFSGRSMNRLDNSSGSGVWLLLDAAKPRGVRKVEPRPPAGHAAESSHRLRPMSRGGGPKRGVGSEGHHHRLGLERPELAARRSGVFLCPSLGISPRVRSLGIGRRRPPEATDRSLHPASESGYRTPFSVVGPFSATSTAPLQKFARSGDTPSLTAAPSTVIAA